MHTNNYSHYSVLDSIQLPQQIALRSWGGYAAICDINSLAGIVQFHKGCTNLKKIPIIGLTVLLDAYSTLILYAMNYDGYKELLQLLGKINSHENYIGFNKCSFRTLRSCNLENVVAVTGYRNSSLANQLTETDSSEAENHLGFLISAFTRDRLYIQIDALGEPEINTALKEIAKKHKIQTFEGHNRFYYPDRDGESTNKNLYRIVQAKKYKTVASQIKLLPTLELDYEKQRAYKDPPFPCEQYEITSPPKLPKYNCPDGLSSIEYLKSLCRPKYKAISSGNKTYEHRILKELRVLEENNLADYFLTLHDIVHYAKSCGHLVGAGRGSAGGCLVSYLLGITEIDPIKHDLIFERFFNEGRKGSLPDIDIDFPKDAREGIISYINKKFGEDRVGQIATYQTFMGRAALKEVLRTTTNISPQEINEITKHIVDKAKIADELEQMRADGQHSSVIIWALQNKSRHFAQYVNIDEQDNLVGPLANEFHQAIQLEGIKSSQSKHAAGVVISNDNLSTSLPTLYDKTTEKTIVGLEYEDAEALGATKLDVLGISTLSKLQDI